MEAFDYAKMVVERGPKESYVYNITGINGYMEYTSKEL